MEDFQNLLRVHPLRKISIVIGVVFVAIAVTIIAAMTKQGLPLLAVTPLSLVVCAVVIPVFARALKTVVFFDEPEVMPVFRDGALATVGIIYLCTPWIFGSMHALWMVPITILAVAGVIYGFYRKYLLSFSDFADDF